MQVFYYQLYILIAFKIKLLDFLILLIYYISKMLANRDKGLIERFIKACAKRRMTLAEMGNSIERTQAWASLLFNGKITRLQFATRNRMKEFLGEL